MKVALLIALALCAPVEAVAQKKPATGVQTQPAASAAIAALTYNQLISAGYDRLKEARLGEAYLAAMEAAKRNPKRFEAYALAALSLHQRGADREATPLVAKALALAPAAKRPVVMALSADIARSLAAADAADPELRRKRDVLKLILDDADKVQGAARLPLLKEFIDKSEPIVQQNPDDAPTWILRAAASVEAAASPQARDWANREGRRAALQLMRLGQDRNDNKDVRRLMAVMDRDGWIYPMNLEVPTLVAAFNRLLRETGPVTGNSPSNNTIRQSSYGDLSGDCPSGMSIHFTEIVKDKPGTGPNGTTRTWVESSVFTFIVSDDQYWLDSIKSPSNQPYEALLTLSHFQVSNRTGQLTIVDADNRVTTTNYVPQNATFVLGADQAHVDQIVDGLNRIHWGCLSQQH